MSLQNYLDERLNSRFVALASSEKDINIFNLESEVIGSQLASPDKHKTLCMDWIGTNGQLICGDDKGNVHLFL